MQKQNGIAALYTGQTNQHFLEWKLDSINNGTVLQIWPKGRFTFSPGYGFEGEAERVLVISNVRRSAAVLKLKDSLVNHKDQLKVKSTIQKTEKEQNKDMVKTETPAFWLITGLSILALAGLFIYKFFK